MLANISFDIDGLWSALEFHNIHSDPKKDVVLEKGIPLILDSLKKHEIQCIFYVVGKNVENYKELHRRISDEQEVGNHTYNHLHNLKDLNPDQIRKEVEYGHNAIVKNLKVKPYAFRAPTYGISKNLLRILKDLNYKYDSSVMPSYYPRITPFKNLFLKKKPHFINGLFEVPLSVNPLIPIYVNGTTVISLGMNWLKFSMKILEKFKLPLVINFHDRDAVDLPDVLKKHFRRGKNNSFEIMNESLRYIKNHAKIVSLEELEEDYSR